MSSASGACSVSFIRQAYMYMTMHGGSFPGMYKASATIFGGDFAGSQNSILYIVPILYLASIPLGTAELQQKLILCTSISSAKLSQAPTCLCLPCTHAQACVVKQVDTSKLSTKDRLHVRTPFFAFVHLSGQHTLLYPVIQAFVLSNNVTVKPVTEENSHFTLV